MKAVRVDETLDATPESTPADAVRGAASPRRVDRTLFVYLLSGAKARAQLSHELSYHDDVATSAVEADGRSVLVVESSSVDAVTWEIQYTVLLFDPSAHLMHRTSLTLASV